ncbi:hypothetical protein WA1_25465 [Scytonema hofmannii PCC 7110]|uniref:Uncharacterized protein n=1 Tax=Scytonema hofmannii PCC 7110 TaxID=128403 RepID=A0A139X8E0_9CYAN|nr:hypothetical protein [Scytonema hofmannii]KYC40964.1 hypothetical protein WA1_25465 [Scytonema hofmannii PCC 7110]
MKRSLTTAYHLPKYFVNIATVVILFLGGLGVAGSGFFLRKAISSGSQSEIVSDRSEYKDIRHKLWSNQGQIKHFPTVLPADALDVRVAYSSGSSEGNRFFQLRLKRSPQTIQNLLSQYRAMALHKYQGGNTNDHANQVNGVPTTFFHTSDSQEESFPPSYEVLVLGAHDKGSSNFRWNHGESFGVAIDSSTSEIIYWVEEW